MAQVFRIVLKVKAEGQEVIKETAQDLKQFNEEVNQTSTAPFDHLAKTTKEISENVIGISKNIQAIGVGLANVIIRQVGKTNQIIKSQTTQIAKETGDSFEKTYARIGLGFSALLIPFRGTLVKQTITFASAFKEIDAVFGSLITSSFTLGIEIAQWTFQTQSTFANLIGISGILRDITDLMGAVSALGAGLISSVAVGIPSFLILKNQLNETFQFFQRVFGGGAQIVSPLERVSNVFLTIDQSVRNIGFNFGNVLKTVSTFGVFVAGILTGPIAGLLTSFGFFNSLISTFFNFFTRGRLLARAFLGDSSAQIQLIIFDIKNLVTQALPAIKDKATAFITLKDQAEQADRELKKLTADTVDFNKALTVRRANLPIQQQFALFALETKSFLKEITTQGNQLFLLIGKGLGASDTQLASIRGEAKLLTSGTAKDIEKTTLSIDNIFQSSRKNLSALFNPIEKLQQIFRTGFGFAKTALTTDLFGGKKAALLESGENQQKQLQLVQIEQKKLFFESSQGAKLLGESITNLGKIIEGVVTSSKLLPTIFTETKEIIDTIPKAINKIPESFTGIRDQLKNLSQEIFNLQKAPILPKANPERGGPAKIQGPANALLGNFGLKGFAEGKIGIDKAIDSLKQFEKITLEVSNNLGTKASAGIEKFQNLFRSGKFNMNVDPKVFAGLLSNFETELNKLADKLGTRGKTLSSTLTNTIRAGIEGKGRAEVEDIFGKFTNLIGEFFPASPAKRGALMNIPKWGPEIGNQLATGIKKGQAQPIKAVRDLTDEIAKYFPQSPALLGALVALPKMGLGIASQLASGILSGINVVIDATKQLADAIFTTAKKSAETQNIAERFGLSSELLSSYNVAIASVGGSTSDLTFTLQSFQRILSQTLTLEDIEKFEKLGINIAEAKSSGQPFVALMNQVADGLKDAGAGSEKFGKILESVGLTANSNFVNVLLKGSEELKKLQIESIELGTTTSTSLGKVSKDFIGLVGRYNLIKETFLNGVTLELLPAFTNIGNELLDLYKENQSTIQGFLQTVATVFANAAKLTFNFVKILIVEPKRGFSVLLGIFNTFVDSGADLFAVLFNNIARNLSKFFTEVVPALAPAALQGLGNLIYAILSGLAGLLGKAATAVKNLIVNSFQSIKHQLKNSLTGIFTDTLISINTSASSVPGIGRILKATGLILSEKETKDLKKAQEEIEKNTKGIGDGVNDFLNEVGAIVEKGDKTKDVLTGFVKGLITKEDVDGFQASTKKLADGFNKAVDEIGKTEIPKDAVSQKIKELGGIINDNLKSAFSFAFSGETKAEILSGFESLKSYALGFFTSVAESEPAKLFKSIFIQNVDAQRKEIEARKKAEIEALDASSKIAKEKAEEIKKLLFIPLISEESIRVSRERIKEFKEEVDKLKILEDLIQAATEADPFLGLKLSLEALKNATISNVPIIKDEILGAFEAVLKEDPFVALKASLDILKSEVGGLKEKIGVEAFSKSIGTPEFKKLTKEKPDEALGTLSEGFNATSEENIGKLEPAFSEGFQAATEADPFAALAASFDLFVENTGEKGKLAGQAFHTAFQGAATQVGDVVGQVGSIIGSVFELTGKKSKALFIAQKAMAVAQATINIAQGVSKAIAEGGVAGIVTGIAVAAAGAVQIANIIAQKPPEFQTGGLLPGPSHAEGGVPLVNSKGNVFAEAEGGEYIVSKKATAHVGRSFLDAVNQLRISRTQAFSMAPNIPSTSLNLTRKYADGGPVVAAPFQSAQGTMEKNETVVNLQNINVVDPNVVARYLTSNKGKTQIKNIISDDAEGYRKVLRVR